MTRSSHNQDSYSREAVEKGGALAYSIKSIEDLKLFSHGSLEWSGTILKLRHKKAA